jgi:hypothetical protein
VVFASEAGLSVTQLLSEKCSLWKLHMSIT